MIVLQFILFIVILIAIVWLVGAGLFVDLGPKNLDTSNIKKLLVIYPHPDDEALTVGGLIRRLADEKKEIVLLVLTKGERGNEGAKYDENLKAVRMKELNNVAQILGISRIIQYDFGDNTLVGKRDQIEKPILDAITAEKPDSVVTYDQSGLYGHPDHIVVSKIVTHFIKEEFPKIKLLYASFPKCYYRIIKLPTHMARNPEFLKNRTFPTHKIFLGLKTFTRIFALYSYKSQLYSFKKGSPKFLPFWFYLSTRVFEYYHEAN